MANHITAPKRAQICNVNALASIFIVFRTLRHACFSFIANIVECAFSGAVKIHDSAIRPLNFAFLLRSIQKVSLSRSLRQLYTHVFDSSGTLQIPRSPSHAAALCTEVSRRSASSRRSSWTICSYRKTRSLCPSLATDDRLRSEISRRSIPSHRSATKWTSKDL